MSLEVYEYEMLPQNIKESLELPEAPDFSNRRSLLENEGYKFTFQGSKYNKPNQYNEYSIEVFFDNKSVGYVDIYEEGGEAVPHGTRVDPDHRRKGIASEMYSLFEERVGAKLMPDASQSLEARKLWGQVGRSFGNTDTQKDKNSTFQRLGCDKVFYAIEHNQIVAQIGINHESLYYPLVKQVIHNDRFDAVVTLHKHSIYFFKKLKSDEAISDELNQMWESFSANEPEFCFKRGDYWFYDKKED